LERIYDVVLQLGLSAGIVGTLAIVVCYHLAEWMGSCQEILPRKKNQRDEIFQWRVQYCGYERKMRGGGTKAEPMAGIIFSTCLLYLRFLAESQT
jgi:hypothetical protein